MDSYSNFARFYDLLTGNISYKKRAEYFNRIIEKFGGEKGILLDLACGTGSLSEEMARLGYDVVGVDSSPEMLTVALDKKIESGLPIQYLCQDMTELDLFGTVDAAVCALDSINHLPDINSVRKTFEKVSLFSNPGAIFVFDANTPYKHREVLANNVFVYDLDEVFCVWQNSYDEKTCTVEINLDFFEKNGETYYRFEENFCEKAYPTEELDELLVQSGFKVLGHFELDTFDHPGEKAEKIVFVAQKER